MLDRRRFIQAAIATPIVGAAVMHETGGAGAATSVFTPTMPRMGQAPFLFGLAEPYASLATSLSGREAQLGRAADVVVVYGLVTNPVLPVLPGLLQAGYEVVLCLEFRANTSTNDPAFSLTQIAAGAHDANAVRWFDYLATMPRPVHLRMLHEGNGDWYPWGTYSGTNTVAGYAPAFRHLVTLARSRAASRCIFQFCLSRKNGKDRLDPVSAFYPGDDVVDEMVVNGYNRPEYTAPLRFADVFAPNYQAMKQLNATKPFWVGETASTEKFGNKSAWITDMMTTVRTSMVVDCLTWFDIYIAGTPPRDWPLDTSAAALAAFRTGISISRNVSAH
jgi:hypothetical protein